MNVNRFFPLSRSRSGAALLLCAVLLLTGCKSEVYQGLSESQANAMMGVLLKNGIVPEKSSTKNGYTISVENDQISQTLELMRENNLPRSDFETMGEVFAAQGMISSATEEKARLTYAISQELSDTFSRIDGVLTSRVHVVLGSEDLGTGKVTPATAAVFLRHTPESQAPNLVPRMKELVANAVPGLVPERVSVMLVPVRETITVPMLGAEEAGVTRNRTFFFGALALCFAALAGFLGAAWFWWQGKKGAASARPSDRKIGESDRM